MNIGTYVTSSFGLNYYINLSGTNMIREVYAPGGQYIMLSREAGSWLYNNASSLFAFVETGILSFSTYDDAIAFKLAWG